MEADPETTIARLLSDAENALVSLRERLESYLRWLCSDLAATNIDFRYRWLESRIKKASSVYRNQQRGGWPLAEMWMAVNDMIGARVIVVTQTDVETLIARIAGDGRFPVAELTRQNIDQRQTTGYRATHLKGHAAMGQLVVGCELQIRTALQDAWAVVSREDLYAREGVPPVIQSMARVEAWHLAASDEALERIRAEARQATPPLPERLDAERR